MNSFERAMEITKGVSAEAALTTTECKAFWNYLLQMPADGLFVEVGCQYGRSSSLIAQAKKDFGFRSIHIDPWVDDDRGAQVVFASWAKLMHLIGRPFTLLCMKTEEADWYLERLCRDGIDMVFIDGDHEGPAVEIDMKLVAARIKPGGVMLCHDYTHPHFHGLHEAIDSFTATGWTKEGQHDSLGVWRRQ